MQMVIPFGGVIHNKLAHLKYIHTSLIFAGEFFELGRMLPLPAAITSQLDKEPEIIPFFCYLFLMLFEQPSYFYFIISTIYEYLYVCFFRKFQPPYLSVVKNIFYSKNV